MKTRVLTVVSLLTLLCSLRRTDAQGMDSTTYRADNLDIQEPIVRASPASDDVDLFGFSAVLHQLVSLESSDDLETALGKTRIIIGAPKGTYPGGLPLDDPGDPRSNETGLVYMCPVEPGECEGVRGNLSLYSSDLSNDRDNPEGRLFDHFPIANLSRTEGLSETEFEIKTGQLLGMTLFSNGDTFIACAPRWTFRPDEPQPRGRCYQSDRTLQGFTLLYPCSESAGGSTGSTNGNSYCLTGTGVTAVDDSGTMTFVLGSPGYNNGRGVLYYHEEGNTDVDGDLIFDLGQEQELDSNGVLTELLAVYQGYQVINGYITNSRTSGENPDILASVPRYNASTYSGTINLYNVDDPDTILSVSASGQQMGEFFGYSLVAADLTGDGYDEVIVGAPMYSDIETGRVEKGRVFVFENLGGTLSDEPVILLGKVVNGRFGSSLTNLGDVDNDGYEDLVVGAPYACSNPVPNCDNQNTGTVFIYYGRADLQAFGDQIPYVIQSGDIVGAVTGLDKLFTFGFSLSSGVDIDNNQYNDLVVGAFESKVAIVIRSLPVADVNINLPAVDPLDLEGSQCMFNGEVFPCFDLKIEAIYSGRGLSGPLDVNFTLSEIVISGERRIFFDGDDPESFSGALTFVDNDNQTVKTVRIYTMDPATIKDILNPLMVEISTEEIQRPMAPADYDGNQTLNDLSPYPRLRVIGTLDQMIELLTACGDDNICDSNLMLEVGDITYLNTEASGNLTEVNEFLVGVVDTVDIEIIYRNIGPENAVGTTLTFTPTGVANEIITGAKIVDLNNVCEVDLASTYTCSLESPITAPETKTNILRLTVDDDAMMSALEDGRGNFPMTFSVSVLNSPSSRENDTTNNDDMATFDLIGRADIYTTLDFNPITARYGGSGVVDVTSVNDLGVDIRLNIAVGNNGPIPADNVQLVLYFPSMAGDGSGFYLYPASLTTLTQNSVVNCSVTSFDPENLVPIEGNRRRRSTMSPAMRRKRKAAIAGFKRVPRDEGGRADTMLDCSATMDACQRITCNISDLVVGMRGETQLSLISHVDERFYNGRDDTIGLTAFSFVDLSETGYLQMSNDSAAATVTICPPLDESSGDDSSFLIHAIIWPIIFGILLIIVLALILYFGGCLRRKKPQEEKAEGDFDVTKFKVTEVPKEGAEEATKL